MKIIAKLLIFLLIVLLIMTGIIYFSVFFTLDNNQGPYIDLIEKYSAEYGLEENLIAAIIKVESNYDEKATSHMGALGLMQVLPDTAQWVCDKINMEYKESLLFEPEYNIKIGAYYFKYLFNLFKSEDLAIMAYNGGLGNVFDWLEQGIITSDPKSYLDIPFYETRTYLSRVKDNKALYSLIWEPVIKSKDSSQWERTNKYLKAVIKSYIYK